MEVIMFEVGRLYQMPKMDCMMKVYKVDGGMIHYYYLDAEWACQKVEQIRPVCQMATGWTKIEEN